MSSTYQRLRSQNEPTGMKRNAMDLKQSIKMSSDSLLQEEDFDISEYLDTQVMHNATLTGRIKSTLNRFDNEFGKPAHKGIIISENNSSDNEDKNDET